MIFEKNGLRGNLFKLQFEFRGNIILFEFVLSFSYLRLSSGASHAYQASVNYSHVFTTESSQSLLLTYQVSCLVCSNIDRTFKSGVGCDYRCESLHSSRSRYVCALAWLLKSVRPIKNAQIRGSKSINRRSSSNERSCTERDSTSSHEGESVKLVIFGA